VKWLLSIVAILAIAQAQPIKCERQTADLDVGDFTNGDFVLNDIQCRAKDSPILWLVPGLPTVAIEWHGHWLGFSLPPPRP
jgi:hypothetical protein